MNYQQYFKSLLRKLSMRTTVMASATGAQGRYSNQKSAQAATYMLLMAPLAYKMMVVDNQSFFSQAAAQCEEAPRADRIRGTYENKIRFFSPPEKIFETFASVKTEEGKLVMSPSDFFRALTPYNYTEMRDNKGYFEKF